MKTTFVSASGITFFRISQPPQSPLSAFTFVGLSQRIDLVVESLSSFCNHILLQGDVMRKNRHRKQHTKRDKRRKFLPERDYIPIERAAGHLALALAKLSAFIRVEKLDCIEMHNGSFWVSK